jgi:hypothetical protein
MKTLTTFLSVISIVLGITACEESPEDIFDMSAIPGQYEGYTEVLAPDLSAFHGWSMVRRIPEDYNAKDIYSIQKVKNNQYTLTFGSPDTILPEEITFELSGFWEPSYHQTGANIKVLENDLWHRSNYYIAQYGMYNFYRDYNQFFYTRRYRTEMSFIFVLKSETWDDITIVCYGYQDF